MSTYRITVNAYWYARIDGQHHVEFSDADIPEGLSADAYAKQLASRCVWPTLSHHDFDQNRIHEDEQILGDLVIEGWHCDGL